MIKEKQALKRRIVKGSLLGGLKVQVAKCSGPLFLRIVNDPCDPASLGPLCRMKVHLSVCLINTEA